MQRSDILNRLKPSYLWKPKDSPLDSDDPDPRMQADQARKLSKYVFPRQYKLTNGFERPMARQGEGAKVDFENREREIIVSANLLCSHQ